MRKLFLFIASFLSILSLGVVVAPTAVYAQDTVVCQPGNDNPACQPRNRNDLLRLLGNIIRFLAIGIGVVVTFMVGYSGFRYLTAGDNPSQVADAKSHLGNAFLALILYIFGMALLNFVVPGSITGLF